jgi:hypothetical protein
MAFGAAALIADGTARLARVRTAISKTRTGGHAMLPTSIRTRLTRSAVKMPDWTQGSFGAGSQSVRTFPDPATLLPRGHLQ